MNGLFPDRISPNWISAIGRLGFIAKGMIYFSIGLLASQIAVGMGGSTYSPAQMLKHFIYKPYGIVLLIFCLIGLFAHAVWKLINGYYEIEDLGHQLSGYLNRLNEIVVGLLYLSFSYATLQILLGSHSQNSGKSAEIWVANILALPFGKWIVFIIALVFIVLGGFQFYYVITGGFNYRIASARMSEVEKRGYYLAARIGLAAWGIVYLMLGFMFFQAAKNSNPDQAGGLGQALSSLQQEPYGAWVLGATSIGLLIYGLYLFMLAYYHENMSID